MPEVELSKYLIDVSFFTYQNIQKNGDKGSKSVKLICQQLGQTATNAAADKD